MQVNKIINDNLKKSPKIRKSLLEFHEKTPIPVFKLKHFLELLKDPLIQKLKLVYSQYNSFDELYNLLLAINKDETIIDKHYFNRSELIEFCLSNNISYHNIQSQGNIVLIEINSYQEMKNFEFKEWCIVRSEDYYNSYTINNKKQFIIYEWVNDFCRPLIFGFTTTSNFGCLSHIQPSLSTPFFNETSYLYTDFFILNGFQHSVNGMFPELSYTTNIFDNQYILNSDSDSRFIVFDHSIGRIKNLLKGNEIKFFGFIKKTKKFIVIEKSIKYGENKLLYYMSNSLIGIRSIPSQPFNCLIKTNEFSIIKDHKKIKPILNDLRFKKIDSNLGNALLLFTVIIMSLIIYGSLYLYYNLFYNQPISVVSGVVAFIFYLGSMVLSDNHSIKINNFFSKIKYNVSFKIISLLLIISAPIIAPFLF